MVDYDKMGVSRGWSGDKRPLKGHDYGEHSPSYPIGFMMNGERVLFKKIWDDRNREQIDKDNCENYKRWDSHGKYQLLNYLGDDGWELIKSSGPYLFKRPLK